MLNILNGFTIFTVIYLFFFPKRVNLKKCNNPVCNLYDKNNYVAHIRTLEQTLNHRLVLKKVHKAIHFNQKACLESFIDVNTNLRTEERN